MPFLRKLAELPSGHLDLSELKERIVETDANIVYMWPDDLDDIVGLGAWHAANKEPSILCQWIRGIFCDMPKVSGW